MKTLKIIFPILILLLFSHTIAGGTEFKIINSPTAFLLENSEYFSQLQFEDNGNIRFEAEIGAFNWIEIGISMLLENIIGSDSVSVDIPQPYVAVKLLTPSMGAPFYMKIGWDGKDILPQYPASLSSSRRGLFLSATWHFQDDKKEYGTITTGFHSPFIEENYIGIYLSANLYMTKLLTLYFVLDDAAGFFISETEPFKWTDFVQGGPGIKLNMNRNWGLGLQFLFDGRGNFYRYFFVHFTRWL